MSIQAEKTSPHKEQPAEKNQAKKMGEFAPGFELEDSRPQFAVQRKLQAVANTSPQSQMIDQLQQQNIQKNEPIQRMVAINSYKNVYLPDYLKPESVEDQTRMKTTINTLTQRTDKLEFTDSSGVGDVFTKNIGEESKRLLESRNKYTDKAGADQLTATASREQQNREMSPEGRKEITDKLGADLDEITNATWKRNSAIHHEFSKEKELYLYKNDLALESAYEDPTAFNLIAPGDMVDAPLPLGEVGNGHDICAIQAISDLGGNVKTMWPELASSTTAEAWHTACKAKGLDYRNDNEYIKILKKLKYNLVKNDSVPFDAIEWADLGDGYYFLATGTGDIGHAIGVRVTAGAVSATYDRQGLHADDVNVKYIFKK